MSKELKPQIRFKGFEDDWESRFLSELGDIKMCKRIMKHQTSEEGEVPFYKIGTFGGQPDAYISKRLFDNFSQNYPFPQKGDVIISAAGTIGKTVVFDGKPAYFQDSNLIWIDNDNSIIDNTFLAVAVPSIKWVTSSTTIARIYNDTVRMTKILSPISKEEQIKIGELFSKTTGLIYEIEREIGRLEKWKQASLQKMFPRPGSTTPEIRFAGFTKPWKLYSLQEIGTWQKGQYLSKEDMTENGENLCLHYGQLFSETENIYNVKTKTDIIPICISEGNELLFPDSDVTPTGLGRCSCIDIKGVILGSGINILKLFPNFYPHFCSLNITFNKSQIIERITGTTVKHIHPKNLSQIDIYIPKDIKEQEAIAKYFRDLDFIISSKHQKLTKLRQIKQACLNKMFIN